MKIPNGYSMRLETCDCTDECLRKGQHDVPLSKVLSLTCLQVPRQLGLDLSLQKANKFTLAKELSLTCLQTQE